MSGHHTGHHHNTPSPTYLCENMKHYAFCSFGKDSLATVLLAIHHGEPLDGVIYCEVMYDHRRGISAEHPEHIEWINNVAVPRLEEMGVKVIISRSQYDFLTLFHSTRTKGINKGMLNGYPMRGKCYIENYCKLEHIHRLKKELGEFVEYVGIAADEEPRLRRLKGRKVSLLAKYGVTEAQAMQICKDAGLLSPTYDYTHRGGCFFCPSATLNELHHFSTTRPEIWDELLELGTTPGIVGDRLIYPHTNDQLRKRIDDLDILFNDPEEKWLDVEGTNGMYLISSKGRIFSVAKYAIVAQTLTPTGRRSVVFTVNRKQTRRLVENVYNQHFNSLQK